MPQPSSSSSSSSSVEVDAILQLIHLLEGNGIGGEGTRGEEERKALEVESEKQLEILVVKFSSRYDFSSEKDDFVANATSRLFEGILNKWLLKENWLRCPGDDNNSTSSTSSYARPGLILNVLQLIRLFTRDVHFRGILARARGPNKCKSALRVLSRFLSWRTRQHFEEKSGGTGEQYSMSPLGREMLVETVSIIRRLATDMKHCDELIRFPFNPNDDRRDDPERQDNNNDDDDDDDDDDSGADDHDHEGHGIPGTLALLLHTNDYAILPLAMDSLNAMVQRMNTLVHDDEGKPSAQEEEEEVAVLVEMLRHVVSCGMDVLLEMVERFSRPFDKLALSLLHSLLTLKQVRVKVFMEHHHHHHVNSMIGTNTLKGKPAAGVSGSLVIQRLVSKFSYCDVELYVPILHVLKTILQESLMIADLRDVGGIPIILNGIKNLNDEEGEGEDDDEDEDAAVDENANGREGKGGGGGGGGGDAERLPDLLKHRDRLAIVTALSECISVISVDDEASYQVKQHNGVYLLGRCLVQPWHPMDKRFFKRKTTLDIPIKQSSENGNVNGNLEMKVEDVSYGRAAVLRALRYVFSSERNRDIFKKLMSPEFFSDFIDVGHYQPSIKPYLKLAEQWQDNEMEAANASSDGQAADGTPLPSTISYWTRVSLKEVDRRGGRGGAGPHRNVLKRVNGYEFVEVLGKGAFGSVYKAKYKNITNHPHARVGGAGRRRRFQLGMEDIMDDDDDVCAVKELALDDVHIFGATQQEQEEAKNAITQEMKILSEMDHPGIVHYYESFEEEGKVYIAMEYAGGMSLADRITSLSARSQQASEHEVWQVLIQLVLALRYMHQDKHIVHRDLTPANVIISFTGHLNEPNSSNSHANSESNANSGSNGGGGGAGGGLVVRITDFGYAKRKESNTSSGGGGFVMRSLVGTITFCCPEIVQHQVYTDKADVWSLGCILYNLMLLKPPFVAKNIFNIASKIVEGQFNPPIEDGEVPYSDELKHIVSRMLTVNQEERPSIGDLMHMISHRVAKETDHMRSKIRLLEHEIHMERKDFVREKRIAMKTHKALERASSARSSDLTMEAAALAANWSNISSSSSIHHHHRHLSPHHNHHHQQQQQQHLRVQEDAKVRVLGGDGMANTSANANTSAMELTSQSSSSHHGHSHLGNGTSSPKQQLKRDNSISKISIPQRNLRVLTDPVVDMLTQVQKLMLVAQLPPSLHHDERRQFLQRVHSRLFASDQRAGAIKAHLAKLMARSPEAIDLRGLFPPTDKGRTNNVMQDISYAHVYEMLEDILKETGFLGKK